MLVSYSSSSELIHVKNLSFGGQERESLLTQCENVLSLFNLFVGKINDI